MAGIVVIVGEESGDDVVVGVRGCAEGVSPMRGTG
jgi:hypothetical protein